MQDNPLIKMPIMERITALALTPDGRLCLAGGINGGLYGWEVSQAKKVGEGELQCVLGNCPLCSCSYIYQITTGRMVICVRSAHYRKINAIVVFDDSALCATAGDDALVRVWSLLRCGLWRNLTMVAQTLFQLGLSRRKNGVWNPLAAEQSRHPLYLV